MRRAPIPTRADRSDDQIAVPPTAPPMDILWRSYTDVVAVLSAITRSARLVEQGVCVASQLDAIDLLNSELEVVWTRWDTARGQVIARQMKRHEP
jgi:hypothetical protein